MLMVALTSQKEPENTENITWLYLPSAKGQIERAMERSGIDDLADMRFRFGDRHILPRTPHRYVPQIRTSCQRSDC